MISIQRLININEVVNEGEREWKRERERVRERERKRKRERKREGQRERKRESIGEGEIDYRWKNIKKIVFYYKKDYIQVNLSIY